jgi:hypothetical protein
VLTIAKLRFDSWRVRDHCKGRYANETFLGPDSVFHWSRFCRASVDSNETPVSAGIGQITKFGELVRIHIEDMAVIGKFAPPWFGERPPKGLRALRVNTSGKRCAARRL